MTTTTLVEQPRMDIAGAAPDLYRDLVALGGDLRLDPGLRQLVNLRASILNGCAYCIDMHAKEARRAGEREQRLYALAAWRETPFFNERERAALALTDAITLISDRQVPREVWDQASRQFCCPAPTSQNDPRAKRRLHRRSWRRRAMRRQRTMETAAHG
jgi:AhpD family alkylhydroperoxidase